MKNLIILAALVTTSALAAKPPAPAVFDELNATLEAQVPLDSGWENPPRLAQTRVWWWWLNGDTDKATITRDLEAMKATGIGGANIIDAGGDYSNLTRGPTFASAEWIELFRHAIAEADRLGLEMGFNIQSGWNLGGPGVTPEESSKKVAFSLTTAEGGKAVDMILPKPETKGGFYAEVAVLAVPAVLAAADSKEHIAQIAASSHQAGVAAGLAADGDPATFWVSSGTKPGQGPSNERSEWLELRFNAPVMAEGIEILSRTGYGPTLGWIELLSGGQRKKIADFTGDGIQPIRISFPPSLAEALSVRITGARDPRGADSRNVQIAELTVTANGRKVIGIGSKSSGAHLLAQKAYFEKPGGFAAAEAWHLLDSGPTGKDDATVAPERVVDLTEKMDSSGRLRWDAPPGVWRVYRFGSTLSGARVSTHSRGAGGLAIDYLDRVTLDSYWKKTLTPIFTAVKPYLGKSLRFVHTDSWELGPVNWTRLMPQEFQRLRGYDIKPWLPVLAGELVGSREQTDRFLNDFRRTLGDLMAENKYEGFSENARSLGLGIHPESGGPHPGPMDALRNLGISDMPMGEFWSPSPRHRTRDRERYYVKQTTSAARVYGRRISFAEAFTNIGRHWQHDPRSLKATFDRAACEGHNLTMWHTFASSKAEHGLPGMAYFAGEHFNPNITWWAQGKAFIQYLNRCHFMLQQGLGSSDVLHFYGENIPSFVRLKSDDPAKCLPGYDYDVINAHALLHRVRADADGNAVLPDGTRYRIISLVPHDAVGLPVLRHLAQLVGQGVTLVGPKPGRPFSLTGGVEAAREFHELTDRLWGPGDRGTRKVGKGRVIWGMTTREVLQTDGVPEDFSWNGGDRETFIDFIQKHTSDARIYFVANRNDRPEKITLRFRGVGLLPEIWDPVTGSKRDATSFKFNGGLTEIPYRMEPEEAFFVVFRKQAASAVPDGPANIPGFKELTSIHGPWQVSFDPKWGGPELIVFDELVDWTTRAEEGIRHYSGTAVYRKTFEHAPVDGPVQLDLGMVESLCEVKLNGQDLGVWWSFPFRRDVTRYLKTGANELEIKVVNLWCNRLIGDSELPKSQQRTKSNIRLAKDTPLEPSGLLGPVKLLKEVR